MHLYNTCALFAILEIGVLNMNDVEKDFITGISGPENEMIEIQAAMLMKYNFSGTNILQQYITSVCMSPRFLSLHATRRPKSDTNMISATLALF